MAIPKPKKHQGIIDLEYRLRAIEVGAHSPLFTGLREEEKASPKIFETYMAGNQVHKLREDLRVRPAHYDTAQTELIQQLVAGNREHPEQQLTELLFRYMERAAPVAEKVKTKSPEPSYEDSGHAPTFESQDYGPTIAII